MSTFKYVTAEEWNDALDDYWRIYYPDQPLLKDELTAIESLSLTFVLDIEVSSEVSRYPMAMILLYGDVRRESMLYAQEQAEAATSVPEPTSAHFKRVEYARHLLVDGMALYYLKGFTEPAVRHVIDQTMHRTVGSHDFMVTEDMLRTSFGLR